RSGKAARWCWRRPRASSDLAPIRRPRSPTRCRSWSKRRMRPCPRAARPRRATRWPHASRTSCSCEPSWNPPIDRRTFPAPAEDAFCPRIGIEHRYLTGSNPRSSERVPSTANARQVSTLARLNRITRRAFLIGAGAAAAALGATLGERVLQDAPEGTGCGIGSWPGLDWHLFSETSAWVAPLDTTNVDPRSDVYISSLVSDGPPAPAGPRELFGWGFPLYFGRATDSLYR